MGVVINTLLKEWGKIGRADNVGLKAAKRLRVGIPELCERVRLEDKDFPFCSSFSQPPPMTDIGILGRDRRQALYNAEERAVIDAHKDDYLKATSPPERKTIAQNLLADIFNHWTEKGIDLSNRTERQQVCWIGIGTYLGIHGHFSSDWWDGFATIGGSYTPQRHHHRGFH
jgi:hypothetical protein